MSVDKGGQGSNVYNVQHAETLQGEIPLGKFYLMLAGKNMFIDKDLSFMQEHIELQEFSLGLTPPLLGLNGTRWTSSGEQVWFLVSLVEFVMHYQRMILNFKLSFSRFIGTVWK